MIQEICHDIEFLKQKAEPATEKDILTADNLMDTLKANAENCVGMAANMIGISKAIIVFNYDGCYMEMFNPIITNKSGSYETKEGCLSLEGQRTTKRYQYIKVKWQDREMHSKRLIIPRLS